MGIRVSKSRVNSACDNVLAVPGGATQIKDVRNIESLGGDDGSGGSDGEDAAFGGGEADEPSADDMPEWMHCGVDEAAAAKLLAQAGNREGFVRVARGCARACWGIAAAHAARLRASAASCFVGDAHPLQPGPAAATAGRL